MAQEPTPQTVARAATVETDARLSGMFLLGTFGRETAPQALVRLPGGRTETVEVGDRLQGRRVIAIGDGKLALDQGGRARWLTLP